MTSSRFRTNRVACCAALMLAAPAALASHATGARQASAISVHDGYYIAGGQTYTTLDALESAVRASRPATLLIVQCTPEATRYWLAAVPRFEDLPMHLDVSNESSAACGTAAVTGMTKGPTAIEVEPAVAQYWSRRMP
jgi:hypothetical protein